MNKKIAFIFVFISVLLFVANCVSTEGTVNNTEEIDLTGVSDELLLDDEYYIGKGIAAQILADYKIVENNEVNEYLRFIGATISAETNVSGDIKKTYSFALLDTEEKIAFAAPSGFIFLSKVLMKECLNEDEFAGIVGNLIGLNMGKFAINSLPKELKQKINYSFDNKNNELMEKSYMESIDHIYNYMKAGYSKEAHIEADKEALRMLHTVGYSTEAYKSIITKLMNNGYFFPESSLPSLDERLSVIDSAISNAGNPYKIAEERTKRFLDMKSKL